MKGSSWHVTGTRMPVPHFPIYPLSLLRCAPAKSLRRTIDDQVYGEVREYNFPYLSQASQFAPPPLGMESRLFWCSCMPWQGNGQAETVSFFKPKKCEHVEGYYTKALLAQLGILVLFPSPFSQPAAELDGSFLLQNMIIDTLSGRERGNQCRHHLPTSEASKVSLLCALQMLQEKLLMREMLLNDMHQYLVETMWSSLLLVPSSSDTCHVYRPVNSLPNNHLTSGTGEDRIVVYTPQHWLLLLFWPPPGSRLSCSYVLLQPLLV